MTKVDAVVIGARPAGCITEAYLAKGGLRTVVFERIEVTGGPSYYARCIRPNRDATLSKKTRGKQKELM